MEPAEVSVVVDRLVDEFRNTVPRSTVQRVVDEVARAWVDAPVTLYLPLLVERAARDELRALAKVLSDVR